MRKCPETLKLVSFDCWETLLSSEEAWNQQIEAWISDKLTVLGADAPRIKQSLVSERKIFSDDLYNRFTTPSCTFRLKRVCETLGLTASEALQDEFKAYIASYGQNKPTILIENYAEIFHALSERKIDACVLSNSGWLPGSVIRLCLENTGLAGFFDKMYFSDEMRVAKPSPDIFRAILQDFNVSPSEAVHVGDDLVADVAGAMGAGIRALHYHPGGRCSSHALECVSNGQELLAVLSKQRSNNV